MTMSSAQGRPMTTTKEKITTTKEKITTAKETMTASKVQPATTLQPARSVARKFVDARVGVDSPGGHQTGGTVRQKRCDPKPTLKTNT